MNRRDEDAPVEPCTYYSSPAPRTSRDHVMPQALGTFDQNWAIRCSRFGHLARCWAMNEPTGKTFDAVQMMRSIREQFAAQISGTRLDEERLWLRSPELSDAILRQLMERANP